MPYSICPHCGKKSYSAATLEVWICPYCERTVDEKLHRRKKDKKNDKKQES